MEKPVEIFAYPILVKFRRGMNIRTEPTLAGTKVGSVSGKVWIKAYIWYIKSNFEFWIGLCPAPCRKWVCWNNGKEGFVEDIIMPDPDSDLSSYRAQVLC